MVSMNTSSLSYLRQRTISESQFIVRTTGVKCKILRGGKKSTKTHNNYKPKTQTSRNFHNSGHILVLVNSTACVIDTLAPTHK